MNVKNKKIVITISALVLGMLIFLLYPRKMGTINDVTVTLEELTLYAKKNENAVSQAFTIEHNINSFGKSFWLETYDGHQPIEALYDKAIENLVYHRAMLDFASEFNLIDDASFTYEKEEWNNSKNGLNLWQFLDAKDYQLSDLIKKELLKKYPPTADELEKAFDQLEDKYKRTDFMVEVIMMELDNPSLETMKQLAASIPESWNADEILEFWEETYPNYSVEYLKLDSQEIHKEDLHMMSISEALIDSSKRDIVEGYTESQVFFVINKEGGELLTLETAPRFGEVAYVNALFEEKLQELINKSDISLTPYAEKSFKKVYEK